MVKDMSGGLRVLAIDDSADSAELVARIATGCGCEAHATSAPRAVGELIASYRPDIITLDLCMPETDGIDLMTVLHNAGFTGRLIIISGQDDWFRIAVTKLAEARGLSVVGNLQKPLDVGALRLILSRLRHSLPMAPAHLAAQAAARAGHSDGARNVA